MPTVQAFRDYIHNVRLKASDQGVAVFVLDAEGIHKCVAGPSEAYTAIDACREAMKAEMKPGDKVLRARNGKKMNLTITYKS